MRVREILQKKGSNVIVINPTDTVADLVGLLKQHNLGALVVSVDGVSVAGIVSERDVVRRLATNPDILAAKVSDVMTANVLTSHPEDSVESLMETMTNHRIRHLPVVDADDHLAGMISVGDVVAATISSLQFERDQLQGYVSQ